MPYTQEQIESLSVLYRADGVSVEQVISTLREMERRSVVRTCEYSGEVIEGEPFVIEITHWRNVPSGRHATWSFRWMRQRWVERHYFADQEAAEEFGCMQCTNCGDWFMPDHVEYEGVEVNGDWYCSYDCVHDAGWETCEWCDCWVHNDDSLYIEDGHTFCDSECANRAGWYLCERCNEWTHEHDFRTVHTGGREEEWCESCADYHAVWCDGCDELVDEDDMAYDDEDEYRCPECRGESCSCNSHSHSHARRNVQNDLGRIESWNYCPPIRLFGISPFRMGVELETDSGNDRYAYAVALDKLEGFKEHFWMTNDGSLCNGVEITSHPMDLEYHWKLYSDGLYDNISKIANEYKFVSHNSGNCGLHVSVSRDALGKSVLVQDATILKMMRLMQRFEGQFLIFSRRKREDMEQWASFKTYYDYSPKDTKVDVKGGNERVGVFQKAADFKSRENTKYRAVNICHAHHIEIRIFRGTLKWSTYFASLALVEGMARVAKVKPLEWIENVSWYDFMDEVIGKVSVDGPREMLVAYLDEKGLR